MGELQRIGPGETFGKLLIEKELGSGAFATVYLARDTQLRRRVALKVNRFPEAATGREQHDPVLREAQLVCQLSSPHIVTLYRVHELGEDWAFEMEYVDGGSLKDLLREKGHLPTRDVLRILRGILTGLDMAHRSGIVHRDIKPANVLLTQQGIAKLGDFGLGRQIGEASLSLSEEGMLGTPRYMAPEVVMGDRPTEASDIWSVGVVLYHMLQGDLPFRARTLPDLFADIQNAEPMPLRPDVRPELAEMVRRCLSKSPEDRPSSCGEMLAMLDRMARDPSHGVGERTPVAYAPTGLIGRADELRRFARLLTQAQDGRASTVLVTGEAGIGKSTLLHEVGRLAEKRGFRWLECVLSPVGGLLRPLLQTARTAVEAGSDPRDMLPQISSARFGQAAALLRGLLSEDATFDIQSPNQTLWALEQLLIGLGRERPVGLLIEDAHLCSSEELRMLRELGRRLEKSRVLIAIAFRTRDPEGSDTSMTSLSGLRDLSMGDEIDQIDLGPLGADEIYRLIEDNAGGRVVAPEIAQLVLAKSDGNPLFALVLFGHLKQSGAIEKDDATLRPGPDWDEDALPRRFHDLVERRLDGLPEPQRALLDAAAVDGLEFDGEALAAVIEQPLLSVLRDLQRLYRERGLVYHRPLGYRFGHALFRDVIYAELAPDLRRAIHRRLAEHLEERGEGADPERLGMHWERAGDRVRAKPHLLRAAQRTAARQDLRRTIDLCTRAGLVPGRIKPDDALDHTHTLFQLATALKDAGRADEMDSIYEAVHEAAVSSGDSELQTRAFVRRAKDAYITRGLREGDEERLEEATRTLEPSFELGLAHWLLGIAAKVRGDLEHAEKRLRASDEVFMALGNDAYHSTALHELASVALRAGRVAEAEALYGDAARVSASVGRTTNAAISQVNQALAAFQRGSLKGLDELVEQAVRTFDLEGFSNNATQVRTVLSEVRYALGDWDGAYRAVSEALSKARETKNQRALAVALVVHGRLLTVRGRLTEAGDSLAEASALALKVDSGEERVLSAAAETHRLCYLGDFDTAGRTARQALDLALKLEGWRIRSDLMLWLAEALLHGLPVEAVENADQLETDHEKLALRLWDAARAMVLTEEPQESLKRGVAALNGSGVGERRADMRVIAAWLEAEQLRREGERKKASAMAEKAREDAAGFGHVWLELSLLRWMEQHGQGSDAIAKKVRKIAEGLSDPAARSRLESRWLS